MAKAKGGGRSMHYGPKGPMNGPPRKLGPTETKIMLSVFLIAALMKLVLGIFALVMIAYVIGQAF